MAGNLFVTVVGAGNLGVVVFCLNHRFGGMGGLSFVLWVFFGYG